MEAICRCWWWFGIPSDWFHLTSLHEPNPPGILRANSNSIQKIQFKQIFWNFKKGFSLTQDHSYQRRTAHFAPNNISYFSDSVFCISKCLWTIFLSLYFLVLLAGPSAELPTPSPTMALSCWMAPTPCHRGQKEIRRWKKDKTWPEYQDREIWNLKYVRRNIDNCWMMPIPCHWGQKEIFRWISKSRKQ